MIHFDLPKEKSSIIKVIGVGGGGSNAVNHMYNQDIEGVNFIICNTDAQSLAQSQVPNKIQLGPHLTQGLGAGANPEIGKQATEESLEEIKKILEVNTKMAFITAGMGGGTGTGGAPILSKICKDLGILTVGIVTTPFAYEGKKRQKQAQEGIDILKQYVDTLLVISNDKLRHQFGNLTMKAAFNKADNVLATAAKCITDVITTTGQINVDFADVCTVMRNGGVAILGSATASGENRAFNAIEQALNSPLLNDNDIRGAKWILININSTEGENEFTMDEVEIIQNYLLEQAGEDTDVILGMGYDSTLGEEIGITLIATGFEHNDPFVEKKAVVEEEKNTDDKVFRTLGEDQEDKKQYNQSKLGFEEKPDLMAPVLSTSPFVMQPSASSPKNEVPVHKDNNVSSNSTQIVSYTLDPNNQANNLAINHTNIHTSYSLNTTPHHPINHPMNGPVNEPHQDTQKAAVATSTSGGYLAKPSNIYMENKQDQNVQSLPVEKLPSKPMENDAQGLDIQLVIKDNTPVAADLTNNDQTQSNPYLNNSPIEEPAMPDEMEEQKRRAAERIQKLRNLSFNINGNDPNNEFDAVPAYIRRNMELYNNPHASIENFYSGYTVDENDNLKGNISTINTFLDGKKPD